MSHQADDERLLDLFVVEYHIRVFASGYWKTIEGIVSLGFIMYVLLIQAST